MTRRRRTWLIVGAAVLVAVVAVGFLVWWFVFRDDSPPPPDIATQSEAIAEEQGIEDASPTATPTATLTATSTATTQASPESESSADSTPEPTPTVDGSAALTGEWVVDDSLGSFEDFTSSFAGYRVQEELAGIGGATAVGRTPEVSGGITIDGTTIATAVVAVDLASLETDSSGRDGRVRSALEVDQFPTATFELTTPITLEALPAEGEVITVPATGDFTVHGVTQPVIVDIEASVVGDVIVVIGSFEIAFADYDVTPPSSVKVLSIADVATVEWQLNLTQPSQP